MTLHPIPLNFLIYEEYFILFFMSVPSDKFLAISIPSSFPFSSFRFQRDLKPGTEASLDRVNTIKNNTKKSTDKKLSGHFLPYLTKFGTDGVIG